MRRIIEQNKAKKAEREMKIKEMQVINRESNVNSLENDIFADAPGNNEE